MNKSSFSKIDILKYLKSAFLLFKEQWAFYIICSLVLGIFQMVSQIFGFQKDLDGNWSGSLLSSIVLSLVILNLQVGITRATLDHVNKKIPLFKTFFIGIKPFSVFVRYFTYNLFLALIIVFASLAIDQIPNESLRIVLSAVFFAGTFYVLIRLCFTGIALIDSGLGVRSSMKRSASMSGNNIFGLMLFLLILILILLIGVATLLGLVVALPVALICFVLYYKDTSQSLSDSQ